MVHVPEDRPEKPFQNKFFQAKLTHMYSNQSPQVVILCLFVIAVVFIPVGAATIIASDAIIEKPVRYDDRNSCTHAQTNFTANPQGCTTNVRLTLDKTLTPPVYIYYRLKHFNQNYRMYAKSQSDQQYSGRSFTRSDIEDCEPWRSPKNTSKMYLPCGAVPWSMFNDTISLYRLPTAADAALVTKTTMPSTAVPVCRGDWFSRSTNELLPNVNFTSCVKKGIALEEDRESRFKESSTAENLVTGAAGGTYEDEPGHLIPIVTDEDLMVWSRIAPLSDFWKLYRKITVTLPSGEYVWQINERFDTTSSGAEKYIVLATVSWVGGKNHVLGALFLAMGSISLVLAFGFIGMYIARNKE
jgi:hypothetical protein